MKCHEDTCPNHGVVDKSPENLQQLTINQLNAWPDHPPWGWSEGCPETQDDQVEPVNPTVILEQPSWSDGTFDTMRLACGWNVMLWWSFTL